MSRRANTVAFGFDFQANAAIVLMIDYMAELDSIKVEGEEDVDLLLDDGTYVLAQMKSVVKSSTDFSNVRAKAQKAMETLSEASQKVKARELIYFTNSPDPFHDESKFLFYRKTHRKYDELPKETQELIDKWLSNMVRPLDTSKLKIRVLPFETDDDDERFKEVFYVISDFIGTLSLTSADGLRKRLHEVWSSMLSRDATNSDKAMILKKKDVVWPIIVFVTGRGILDRNAPYCANLDDSEFDEIEHRYGELIEDYSERYDLVIKVISGFIEGNYKGRTAIDSFIDDHWSEYMKDLGLENAEDSIKEKLMKIILYTILLKRYEINRIKRQVKL